MIWESWKAYQALHFRVNILLTLSSIRNRIMCHIVDVVFPKEINGNNPGARHKDLIYPFAVLQNLWSLLLIHDNFSFLFDCFFVSTHTDDQICVRKEFLGLLKHFSMSYVIHIKDAIGIDSNWIVGIGSIRL